MVHQNLTATRPPIGWAPRDYPQLQHAESPRPTSCSGILTHCQNYALPCCSSSPLITLLTSSSLSLSPSLLPHLLTSPTLFPSPLPSPSTSLLFRTPPSPHAPTPPSPRPRSEPPWMMIGVLMMTQPQMQRRTTPQLAVCCPKMQRPLSQIQARWVDLLEIQRAVVPDPAPST